MTQTTFDQSARAVGRIKGVPANVAVDTWVQGIAAAGYNPVTNYPTQVLTIANNYMHPAP